MKKVLSCSFAFLLIALPALAVLPANAGIGTPQYRVFYIHESIIGVDQNGDEDTLDPIVALFTDPNGQAQYIGEGIEPEIDGDFVIWHDENQNFYVFHILFSPPFMPYQYRLYGWDYELRGNGVAHNTHEMYLGQDVNGDNDFNDRVVGYIDLLGFPAMPPTFHYWTGEKTPKGGYDGDNVFYVKYEAEEEDISIRNCDMDDVDPIVFYRNVQGPFLGPETMLPHPSNPLCGIAGNAPRVEYNAVWRTYEVEDDYDWNGDFNINAHLVIVWQRDSGIVDDIDDTVESYEEYANMHFIDGTIVVYPREAYYNYIGVYTWYHDLSGPYRAVFPGIPFKITGPSTAREIEGYVFETQLGVDLDGQNGVEPDAKAIWIFNMQTGETEVLDGGNVYWR